jgi:hypothetical protein
MPESVRLSIAALFNPMSQSHAVYMARVQMSLFLLAMGGVNESRGGQ